jgi:diguanylate cyclase (GGDEF)-like protein
MVDLSLGCRNHSSLIPPRRPQSAALRGGTRWRARRLKRFRRAPITSVMPLIPVLLLVVAATCAASLPFLWRQRDVPGAVGLLALFAAVAWWNAGYALEIATGGLGAKLFWAKAQYPGIVVAPLAVFVFALGYTGRWEWLTARRLAALLVVPAGTIALAWTHELHHLVWSDVGTPVAAGQPLVLDHGIGFFPGWLFAYAMLFSATVMLVAGRWSLRRYFRRQSIVIAISVLTPWLCNAIYVLGLTPDGLDMTTVGLAVTAVGFALARSRWGLLEISPVARDAVVEHLRDGMVVVDNRGRIVDCNRAAAPLLACPFDDAVGRAAADVLPPGVARAAAPHIVEVMLADGPRAYEVEAVDLPLSAAASGRLILLHDVTAREQLHALLRADALTDELTRIGNRRFFLERLQRALEQTGGSDRPVGVVFLDLDDFKAVNDSFGHDVGDRVLVEIARRVESCVRPQDDVARLGGDEFTVLLPDVEDPEIAVAVAARIGEVVRRPIDVDGEIVTVTVSVGLHLATAPDATPESVLRAADRRMYATKARREQ